MKLSIILLTIFYLVLFSFGTPASDKKEPHKSRPKKEFPKKEFPKIGENSKKQEPKR